MDLALLQAWLDSQQGLLWQGAPLLSHRSWQAKQVAKSSWERLGTRACTTFTPLCASSHPHVIEFGELSFRDWNGKKSRVKAGDISVRGAGRQKAARGEPGRRMKVCAGSWQLGKASLWCEGNANTRGTWHRSSPQNMQDE